MLLVLAALYLYTVHLDDGGEQDGLPKSVIRTRLAALLFTLALLAKPRVAGYPWLR